MNGARVVVSPGGTAKSGKGYASFPDFSVPNVIVCFDVANQKILRCPLHSSRTECILQNREALKLHGVDAK